MLLCSKMQNSTNCFRCDYQRPGLNFNECFVLCSNCKKDKTNQPCVGCKKNVPLLTFLTGGIPLCLDCSTKPICSFYNPHLANQTNLTILPHCADCQDLPRKCCSSLHKGPHIKMTIGNYGTEGRVSYGIRCQDCYEEKKKLYS